MTEKWWLHYDCLIESRQIKVIRFLVKFALQWKLTQLSVFLFFIHVLVIFIRTKATLLKIFENYSELQWSETFVQFERILKSVTRSVNPYYKKLHSDSFDCLCIWLPMLRYYKLVFRFLAGKMCSFYCIVRYVPLHTHYWRKSCHLNNTASLFRITKIWRQAPLLVTYTVSLPSLPPQYWLPDNTNLHVWSFILSAAAVVLKFSRNGLAQSSALTKNSGWQSASEWTSSSSEAVFKFTSLQNSRSFVNVPWRAFSVSSRSWTFDVHKALLRRLSSKHFLFLIFSSLQWKIMWELVVTL